ncbi:hypothetical protein Gogos_010281 [Gossypium gossypioides]|uniref:RNase H type-1 domain-containing protein n=1 Tax=Gossypium gossypioides TaxID=34282 RepID=A0A7J9BKQ3_GOSGO|nr:hypothetical protein [Gossypium gossypioides]
MGRRTARCGSRIIMVFTRRSQSILGFSLSRTLARNTLDVGLALIALTDYPTARAILTLCDLDGRLINNDYNCCIDWIEVSIRLLDKKVVDDFITTLWNSWNNRNKFIFRGKEEDARVIWERVITLSKDFCIHNMVNKSMLPLSSSLKKWEKPLRGTVKIKFDAAVSNTKTGFGVIACDSKGFFIRGGFGFKNKEMTSDWVELYAFEESLKIVRLLNVTKVNFEIDCTTPRK